MLPCLNYAATDFDRAIEAYKAKDYATAIEHFVPMAENGSPKAQAILAMMHRYGEGLPPDLALARGWYEKAAQQNYAVAQYHLGLMYLEGTGGRMDVAAGLDWLRKAADQGNKRAQAKLYEHAPRSPIFRTRGDEDTSITSSIFIPKPWLEKPPNILDPELNAADLPGAPAVEDEDTELGFTIIARENTGIARENTGIARENTGPDSEQRSPQVREPPPSPLAQPNNSRPSATDRGVDSGVDATNTSASAIDSAAAEPPNPRVPVSEPLSTPSPDPGGNLPSTRAETPESETRNLTSATKSVRSDAPPLSDEAVFVERPAEEDAATEPSPEPDLKLSSVQDPDLNGLMPGDEVADSPPASMVAAAEQASEPVQPPSPPDPAQRKTTALDVPESPAEAATALSAPEQASITARGRTPSDPAPTRATLTRKDPASSLRAPQARARKIRGEAGDYEPRRETLTVAPRLTLSLELTLKGIAPPPNEGFFAEEDSWGPQGDSQGDFQGDFQGDSQGDSQGGFRGDSVPLSLATTVTSSRDPGPSKTSAAKAGTKRYKVQLLASRSQDNIEVAWGILQRRFPELFSGLEGTVEEAKLSHDEGRTWYRLRVGPIAKITEAQALCQSLNEKSPKVGCMPVRVRR